jgi:hypothetical protein
VTGDVTSDVGVGALSEARVVALTGEFVAAARHFRAGRAERAMVTLLPLGLVEEELPGRVRLMVAAGLVAIAGALGVSVDLATLRWRVTGHDPEVLVDLMVVLVSVFAVLEGVWDERVC